MTILNLGTYPPKQCGIATFSMDLRKSLIFQGNDVKVMAVAEEKNKYNYPEEVIFEISQQHRSDYLKAAAYINSRPDLDLVIIQHEYGIYGGSDGEYILDLVGSLSKPYVLITHTVLPAPDRSCKNILNYLAGKAAAVVCMTQKSADLMAELYEAPPETLHLIAHGVPEFKKETSLGLKQRFGLEGRQIVSTFGLIGPGKGLELGIKAIARISHTYPDLVYLILGRTHPMLIKHEGEKYRHMLESMVTELKIQDNVQFVNKYLSDEELGQYLYMSDIYLSPYPNRDQAVSGTMAFAIGCGRAIVSTPYSYALEALADGRGLIASQADPQELADLLEKILAEPELKRQLQAKAYSLGKDWTWPNVGKQYTAMFKSMLQTDEAAFWEDDNYYAGLQTFS